MEQIAEVSLTRRYDKISDLIQKQVTDKLRLPIEIQLWGGYVYRLGKDDPASHDSGGESSGSDGVAQDGCVEECQYWDKFNKACHYRTKCSFFPP